MNVTVKKILERRGSIISSKERDIILQELVELDEDLTSLHDANSKLVREAANMRNASLWQRIRNKH